MNNGNSTVICITAFMGIGLLVYGGSKWGDPPARTCVDVLDSYIEQQAPPPAPPSNLVVTNDPVATTTISAANLSNTVVFSGPDGPLAEIDVDTGHVTLHGEPNEAARVFWAAVDALR